MQIRHMTYILGLIVEEPTAPGQWLVLQLCVML